MTTLVVVLLLVLWAVEAALQARRFLDRRRQADSVGAFRDHLAVLERTTPAAVLPVRLRPATVVAAEVPFPLGSGVRQLHTTLPAAARRRPVAPGLAAARERNRRRRIAVLRGLLIAAGATSAIGLIPALRPVLIVHLVVDVALVAYVALLVRHRNAEQERRRKVRYLPTSQGPNEPDPFYGRAVVG